LGIFSLIDKEIHEEAKVVSAGIPAAKISIELAS